MIRAGLIDPRGGPARAGAASAIADPRTAQTPLARSVLAERLAIQVVRVVKPDLIKCLSPRSTSAQGHVDGRLPGLIPCAAMSETSSNCSKMSVSNATGRWEYLGWQSVAKFWDGGL